MSQRVWRRVGSWSHSAIAIQGKRQTLRTLGTDCCTNRMCDSTKSDAHQVVALLCSSHILGEQSMQSILSASGPSGMTVTKGGLEDLPLKREPVSGLSAINVSRRLLGRTAGMCF